MEFSHTFRPNKPSEFKAQLSTECLRVVNEGTLTKWARNDRLKA